MKFWDVFRSDRLEVDRTLSAADIRAALARGVYRDDDLVRPAGTQAPWSRLGDAGEILAADPAPVAPAPPQPAPAPEPDPEPSREPLLEGEFAPFDDDDEDEPEAVLGDEDLIDEGGGSGELVDLVPVEDDDLGPTPATVLPDSQTHTPDVPELDDAGWRGFAADAEEDEDDAAAEFTLSRAGAERVEELDLAAMVDVAFQLVLFFLVTATTVMFKTLEVPRPADDKPPEVVAQGRPKPVEELEKDFILVQIAVDGTIQVDHQAVPSDATALASRLRTAREATGRTAMLLSVDDRTPHRAAVLAYDVASEIGLQVSVAQPTGAPPP